MNILKGEISAIESSGSLSILDILVTGVQLKVIVVETPETASYLKTGKKMRLLFKETEVILSKNTLPYISIENQFPGRVLEIIKGELLSEVRIKSLGSEISAVISRKKLEEIQLKINSEVVVMMKSNEIMLSE
ncbi:TOBE domain-containing protein [Zunongwangia sp. F363]|uniref:TOBE domain-containing protein n=1 Tax=Autumnicola tepida TaxID=3075595 RepID=A0ABU3C8J3_9FLAO|nr:TOBE domain-containing protein [Zunongwangia sp. F363]MDT0642668.1 TOBE domain-containing protein [Zunongwangia sp. F363]